MWWGCCCCCCCCYCCCLVCSLFGFRCLWLESFIALVWKFKFDPKKYTCELRYENIGMSISIAAKCTLDVQIYCAVDSMFCSACDLWYHNHNDDRYKTSTCALADLTFMMMNIRTYPRSCVVVVSCVQGEVPAKQIAPLTLLLARLLFVWSIIMLLQATGSGDCHRKHSCGTAVGRVFSSAWSDMTTKPNRPTGLAFSMLTFPIRHSLL